MKSITEVVQNLLKPYIDRNIETATGVLGAKNLCPNNYTTQVLHGLTITVKDNGEIWVSGSIESGTNSVSMQINNGLPSENEALILTGCPADGGEGLYRIMAVLDNDTRYYDDGNGVTIPANSSISRVNIVIFRNNGQVYDLKFKPMIRPASVADNTYVPYAMTNRELTEVKVIPTGITNVIARRCGNVVMLRMILTTQTFSANWNELGTLPMGLRPAIMVDMPVEDNNALTAATSNNIPIRISQDGKISVWAYSDKLTFAPVGNIVFLTTDPMP